jgi:hypothetical protein
LSIIYLAASSERSSRRAASAPSRSVSSTLLA